VSFGQILVIFGVFEEGLALVKYHQRSPESDLNVPYSTALQISSKQKDERLQCWSYKIRQKSNSARLQCCSYKIHMSAVLRTARLQLPISSGHICSATATNFVKTATAHVCSAVATKFVRTAHLQCYIYKLRQNSKSARLQCCL